MWHNMCHASVRTKTVPESWRRLARLGSNTSAASMSSIISMATLIFSVVFSVIFSVAVIVPSFIGNFIGSLFIYRKFIGNLSEVYTSPHFYSFDFIFGIIIT